MVWFECHFKLVTDQFEVVALVFLVPHALVWFDLMRLLTMELLAVGAPILLCLIVLVRLLFFASAVQLGMLGFLAIACTWLEFFFGKVAVETHTVHQFGVCGVGVLSHHCLEMGYQFGDQMRGSCARCRCVLEDLHAIGARQLLWNDPKQSCIVHMVVCVLLADGVHGQAKVAAVIGFGGHLDFGQQRDCELWDTNDEDTIHGHSCHV